MEKRMLLLGVVLMVVSLSGSAALALTPMGPPTAGLEQAQLSAALEYLNANMDMKEIGGGKLRNVNSNAMNVNLGYGIKDNCEMFVRLGIANADFKIDDSGRFVGDTGFAIGFGTKATFYEDADLKLGGLFQMGWADLHGVAKGTEAGVPFREPVSFDTRDIQLAVGPTYRLMEGVSVYGGPFLHFFRGDGVNPGGSFEIHEAHSFGGYVGTQIDITENLAFNVECQYTGAPASALGMGVIWKF